MKYIDSKTVQSAAPYKSWVDTIENSFQLEQDKDYIMPSRTHINIGNNTLLLMPCIAGKYFSNKIITLYPENSKSGKTAIKGLVVLNDLDDGEPLAIIDGPAITAMRTAAVGSCAIRHMSPSDASYLGIIGLGTQGLHQALFACSERNIRELTIFDKYDELYSAFISSFSTYYPNIKVNIAKSNQELCENADIIITATNAREPVLPDDMKLLAGKLIIGIGSYKENMREFPDSVYKLSGKIYVDAIHGLKESGDLIYPISKGLLAESKILSADHILKDKMDEGSTRVFKSVGMALFDLLGSVLVYETLYMH